MTAMTITATHAQVREADNAEVVMLAYWRTCLEHGSSADLVASLIAGAVDYQPLLGLAMDVCNHRPCHTWVEESARDEHDRIYCSTECREADEQDTFELFDELRMAMGETRREPTYDIDPMTGRWAS